MYTVHKGPSRQRREREGGREKESNGCGGRGRQPTLMKARGKARRKLSRLTYRDKTEAELNNVGIILGVAFW